MMIVIIIIALAASGSSYALGALTRAQLRSSAMRIAAAARFGYNRAISHGTTVRIALNLDSDMMSFEEANGRVMLARNSDERQQDIRRNGQGSNVDNAGIDPWRAAEARLSKTMHASFGASPFSVIEGTRYQPTRLAERVQISRLTTPHEPEPRTSGTGHIYFFPGGYSEHSSIWISDGTSSMSVEIHPLTGRVKVSAGEVELDEFLIDGDGNTRSEVEN